MCVCISVHFPSCRHLTSLSPLLACLLACMNKDIPDDAGGNGGNHDAGDDDYDVHWLTQTSTDGLGERRRVLTYRGQEKALELMRHFNRDDDDMLDLSDFISYLTYFDR